MIALPKTSPAFANYNKRESFPKPYKKERQLALKKPLRRLARELQKALGLRPSEYSILFFTYFTIKMLKKIEIVEIKICYPSTFEELEKVC